MSKVIWRWRKGAIHSALQWIALLLLGLIVVACGGGRTVVNPITLAPESILPPDIRQAPPEVREAYRFAAANQELLSAFPCYCGCGAQGHRNNLDCYIKRVQPDGAIEWEHHAFL